MSARLPRSKGPGALSHSSDEYKKQKKCSSSTRTTVTRGAGQDSASAALGHHPWAGIGDWLLQPLPAEWRYNIQRTFRLAWMGIQCAVRSCSSSTCFFCGA